MIIMQRILSNLRKAIEEYNMIQDGDKIAVALSGGKDSITLLMALKQLQLFYPKKFEIIAVSINPGFEDFDENFLTELSNKIDVPLFIENTNAKEIVFEIRKEKNPCSLCANLRRGAINSVAVKEKCNKIALGHNKDDVLETYMLNTLYTGKISTFAPVAYMDRTQITVIRPLIYLLEKDIKRFIKKENIAVMSKCCPIDGHSKREEMKLLIEKLQKDIPRVKENLFGAITRSGIPGWEKKQLK
ncbi:MAG: tRNA 2-thiocytidine(32) synthetase TtcA [Oscillospiraceae bacterium]|nr:tRNA 2-thiocytidine(32) synthetase TtcA [Oscillospiraceae bacterium]